MDPLDDADTTLPGGMPHLREHLLTLRERRVMEQHLMTKAAEVPCLSGVLEGVVMGEDCVCLHLFAFNTGDDVGEIVAALHGIMEDEAGSCPHRIIMGGDYEDEDQFTAQGTTDPGLDMARRMLAEREGGGGAGGSMDDLVASLMENMDVSPTDPKPQWPDTA